jgi:hypothetical protein
MPLQTAAKYLHLYYRSDIRVILRNSQITEWVDKSHLLCTAADREGCTLMWHKIVLLSQGATSRQVTAEFIISFVQCITRTFLFVQLCELHSLLPIHKISRALLSTRAWVGPYSHTCSVSAKGLLHTGGTASVLRVCCISL